MARLYIPPRARRPVAWVGAAAAVYSPSVAPLGMSLDDHAARSEASGPQSRPLTLFGVTRVFLPSWP